MRQKSLTSEQMEARVARFNKLQTYHRQNFETHNIPPGAVEKVLDVCSAAIASVGHNLAVSRSIHRPSPKRSDCCLCRTTEPGCRHSASSREFTPVHSPRRRA